MNAILTLIICLFTLFPSTIKADEGFTSSLIPDKVWAKMQGKSVPKGCPVKKESLRYLTVRHYNNNGKETKGEIICSKSIANDLLEIFRELHKAKYPIERIRLIDEYNADDETSMRANNSSCFCYRTMTGSSTKVSKHGLGLAIDINPLYNPYVKGNRIEPSNARKYAFNRAKRSDIPMKLSSDDLAVRLFKKHGFRWGGDWKHSKDYQHFEK